MIVHEKVKLRYASIYSPQLTDFDGKPMRSPRYSIGLFQIENLDRPELPWRASHLTGESRLYYNTTVPPRITLKNDAYDKLIRIHDEFRARNIPLDRLFVGAICDIVLTEYHKPTETILQLSELIFDDVADMNMRGELRD